MPNAWLALTILLTCLYAATRHFWFAIIRANGQLRLPVRVKVQMQFPLPPLPQQHFLFSPPPLEGIPTARLPPVRTTSPSGRIWNTRVAGP